MDDSFAALVRGPSTTYPRGFPLLFPAWLAVVFAGVWIAWLRVIGPMPWWYAGTLISGLLIAATTIGTVLTTIRHPAFRADRNGIRLGLRTERKRPRNRQAHLWWSDVRQLRIEPRRYGLMVEVSLGPAARIVRRRGAARQALLWCGMVVLPFCLGRGTPRLTEPRRKDPQYRFRLYDVTPEELGLALAGLALPAVEIIVISRRYGPIMARRPQAAAPRHPAPRAAAPPATASLAAGPLVTRRPGPAPVAMGPPVTSRPAVASPATAPPATVPSVPVTAPAPPPAEALPAAEQPATASSVPDEASVADEASVTDGPIMADGPNVTDEASVADEASVTDGPIMADGPNVTDEASVTDGPSVPHEPSVTDGQAVTDEAPVPYEPAMAEGPAAAEVPMMATPHVGLEVAATAEREASQPAA